MSKSVDTLIGSIEKLSVLELAELVEALEEKFGVVASAPVAAAPAAGTPTEAVAEEKSSYTVVVTNAGDNKINVIKAVREVNQNLGLKDAKDLVDNTPANILEDTPTEQAQKAKETLEQAGAVVELQ